MQFVTQIEAFSSVFHAKPFVTREVSESSRKQENKICAISRIYN